jgi:HEAT repeat protein
MSRRLLVLRVFTLVAYVMTSGSSAYAAKPDPPHSLESLLEAVAICTIPSAPGCEALKQSVARVADDPDILLPHLDSEDTDTRIGASAAMGYVGTLVHLKVLDARLGVEISAAVREAIVGSVGRLGFAEGIPILKKLSEGGVGDRIMAANAFVRLGHADGVPILLSQLGHSHPKVQAAALTALGKLADARAIMPIMDLLGEGVIAWTAKVQAIFALGELKAEESAPLLLVSMGHPEPDVRRRAARALGFLKTPYAVPGLIHYSEDTEIAGEVAIAIAIIGDRSAVPALNWAAMNPELSEARRRQVFWALGMMQDERTVPPLAELCRSQNLQLVLLAAETLGRLGRPSGTPALLGLMEHDRHEVRGMAEWSLKRISGANFGEDFGAWESWIQANVPQEQASPPALGKSVR